MPALKKGYRRIAASHPAIQILPGFLVLEFWNHVVEQVYDRLLPPRRSRADPTNLRKEPLQLHGVEAVRITDDPDRFKPIHFEIFFSGVELLEVLLARGVASEEIYGPTFFGDQRRRTMPCFLFARAFERLESQRLQVPRSDIRKSR